MFYELLPGNPKSRGGRRSAALQGGEQRLFGEIGEIDEFAETPSVRDERGRGKPASHAQRRLDLGKMEQRRRNQRTSNLPQSCLAFNHERTQDCGGTDS
jgi:hypothetical protein